MRGIMMPLAWAVRGVLIAAPRDRKGILRIVEAASARYALEIVEQDAKAEGKTFELHAVSERTSYSTEYFIPNPGYCEGCDTYSAYLHHGRTSSVEEGVWVCCKCAECEDEDCEGREVVA